MSKTIAILQPGYIPWLGFFEQMAYADLFVYMDDVQYTRKDWRSRNQIKVNGQGHWLSVPVKKMPLGTKLAEIEISYDEPWQQKHLSSIRLAYCNTPFFQPLFDEVSAQIEVAPKYLWQLDVALAAVMARHLSIQTPIAYSSSAPRITADKNARIVEICKYFEADYLYDGKSAADFIDTSLFDAQGVKVVFQDYKHPIYAQGAGDFVPYMSALDLLFHAGPSARDILLSSPYPFAHRSAA